MTFAIGFNSANGLVLCTDSLEADGLTKRAVDKISATGIPGKNGWSLALAGAGPGGLLDKFVSAVRSGLRQKGTYIQGETEKVIETTLTSFKSKYEEPFRIIAGLCNGIGMERFLYRSDENYLAPIHDHTHVGMGHSLWRFFTEMLYERGNSVADNTRLAIFIMHQAIRYVDGVDGPIQVATYTFGDELWKFSPAHEIRLIETGFANKDVKEALETYWRMHNPPSLRRQVLRYGGVRTPGDELTILEGVKLEELYTVSGRRRASKICRRNTDKLQQRAIVEGKRYREARSGASLSGDGKTRT